MTRPSYTRNAALRKGREQGRAECVAQLEALLEWYDAAIEKHGDGMIPQAAWTRGGVAHALAAIRVPDEEMVTSLREANAQVEQD